MENSGIDFLTVFLISAVVMLFLSVGVVVFIVIYQRRVMQQRMQIRQAEAEYQKNLLNATLQTQENERQRIAKDLHDEIGAMLSAVKVNVGLVKRRIKKQGIEEDHFGDTRGMIDEAIAQVRRISHDLMPPALENQGLVAALEEFRKKVADAAGMAFELKTAGEAAGIPKERALALFRIVQELTNNALKHARASALGLDLRVENGRARLQFTDNGAGFDPEAARTQSGSLGLKSLESRVNFLDGKLTFDSAPGKGTRVAIEVPLHSLEPQAAA